MRGLRPQSAFSAPLQPPLLSAKGKNAASVPRPLGPPPLQSLMLCGSPEETQDLRFHPQEPESHGRARTSPSCAPFRRKDSESAAAPAEFPRHFPGKPPDSGVRHNTTRHRRHYRPMGPSEMAGVPCLGTGWWQPHSPCAVGARPLVGGQAHCRRPSEASQPWGSFFSPWHPARAPDVEG